MAIVSDHELDKHGLIRRLRAERQESRKLYEETKRLESGIYRALQCAAGNADKMPTVYNMEQILQNVVRSSNPQLCNEGEAE